MCMENEQQLFKRTKFYFIASSFFIAIPILINFYKGYSGKIIVASKQIESDKYFSKTVIYIYSHSVWGAKGIILNKQIEASNEYYGGPVPLNDIKVVLLDQPKQISKLRAQSYTARKYEIDEHHGLRVYNGISGWGTNQLEREVKNNVWTISPCQANQVMDLPIEEMWDHMIANEKAKKCLEYQK